MSYLGHDPNIVYLEFKTQPLLLFGITKKSEHGFVNK